MKEYSHTMIRQILTMNAGAKRFDVNVAPLATNFPWTRPNKYVPKPRRYAPRPDPRISDSPFPDRDYPNRPHPSKRDDESDNHSDRGVVDIDFYI